MAAKMTVTQQQDKWTYKDPNCGCWIWLGSLTKDGYGSSMNRDYLGESLAHRLSYLAHVAPIQNGMEIDHLCRVRCCVNPSHLEPVPHAVNVLRGVRNPENHRNTRKTHCKRGHEFTSENTRIEQYGGVKMRKCNICVKAKNDRANAKRKLVKACTGIEILET